MSCHISVRHIDFHASTEGVRIRVVTDVECRLVCRTTSIPPRIHKIPSYRRGIWIADDVRFCFDVYHDEQQFQTHQGYEHTFWKPDWPCYTQKWVYFWGYVLDEVCPSTSPFFSWLNDCLSPVPVPDTLYSLNPIDIETFDMSGAWNWQTIYVGHDIHEDSYGAVIQACITSPTPRISYGFRKKGITTNMAGSTYGPSIHWIVMPLDELKEFEFYLQPPYDGFLRLVGYTGRTFVGLDSPVDILPANAGIYEDFDVHSLFPNAKIIYTDLVTTGRNALIHSIRPSSSTKDVYHFAYHAFPVCCVGDDGFIQRKLNNPDPSKTKWVITGYDTEGVTRITNGHPIGVFNSGAWTTRSLFPLAGNDNFAVVETAQPLMSNQLGGRKELGLIPDHNWGHGHNYIITHLHYDREADFYAEPSYNGALLIAGTH